QRRGQGLARRSGRGCCARGRQRARAAHIARLVAEHLARGGVTQGHGLAEDAEILHVAELAAHVGRLALGEQQLAVQCAHDPGCTGQVVGLEHHRLAQEGRQRARRHRLDGQRRQRLAARPRRQLHRRQPCGRLLHRGRHRAGSRPRALGAGQHQPRARAVLQEHEG
ncbi:MAG: hypothetical protein ACK56I_08485, partial [bacterium]